MITSSFPLTAAKTWHWRGFPVSYQQQGDRGYPLIFIHGFGASWGHWRKNLPILGQQFRCYALDLIGFGESAKPIPEKEIDYTFETWGEQIRDFCQEVVGSPAFLVGNSIGCIVAMQAAVDSPELFLGLCAINCSLRLLHERKRAGLPFYRSFGATVLQRLLGNPLIGNFFFSQMAQAKTIRKILLQAYRRQEAVTDELVAMLLKPAQDMGAAAVFLAFTRYSGGPLPEDLLPQLHCPVLFIWGAEDPWENLELGRKLANYPNVEDFIVLDGVGHCPQDEAPELVNPIIEQWVKRYE